MKSKKNMNRLYQRCLRPLVGLLASGTAALVPSLSAAPAPNHGIVAANIDVTINDFFNNTNSVTFSLPYQVGDFRIAQEGSNNGDYDTQIGDNPTNNVNDGIMITSVRENGRDDQWITHPNTNYSIAQIDYHRSGTAREGAYWIPVAMAINPTSVVEYDVNVAAAWFPYNKWIGGFARNSGGTNGGTLDLLTGSPGLVLGTNFKDLGGGKSIVDLKSLGIDSRTDGTLLVVGAKNENNYAVAAVNATNGTWNLLLHDVANNATSTEQDPVGFVFIPKTDTNVISGRFRGDGTILTYSGATPQFTVTSNSVGTFELKLIGKSPRYGVLIVSPEGGFTGNQDNIVNYQVNDAGDGWIIESRDMPPPSAQNPSNIPPLETPDNGTSPICGFVFIPGPTPGFAVTPTTGLVTSEAGQQATFTVALQTRPTADVTINVNSSNNAEGFVSPASLTFTADNWNVPQTVTVTGVDDALVDGPVAYSVILSAAASTDPNYNGMTPPSVSLVNADDESGGFVVSPTGGLTTTEAGGQATFTVRLTTAPTADVSINLTSSDTTEGTVSPTSLTFNASNWNQDQTVTITGVDDFVADGNVPYTIITGAATSADPNYNGFNPPDVTVVNQDNDTAVLNIVAPTNGFQVVEGGVNTYTVALNSQPTANVTISIASSDTAQGGTPSPSSLTFTPANWNIPQNVNFSGADDLTLDGNSTWRLTNSVTSSDTIYAALAPVVLSVTTVDNEATITLPSGDLRYGVGQPGVGIDGRAAITDPNTLNYASAKLTVALTANGTADDRLAIRNDGTAPGQISVSGNTVSYGGTAIATFTGGTGTTPLVATFNAAANVTAAQALLRNITYRNVNSNPARNRRAVTVTLTHSDNGTGSATTGISLGLVRFADFQQDADHGYGAYTNAADIELFQLQPDTPLPQGHAADTNNPQMWLDYRDPDSPNQSEALLRFDNIVGNGAGQIPSNAIIVSAELLLNVRDAGDGSPLYRMLIPWDATNTTWNSMGDGIQPDDVEARSTYDAFLGVPAVSGDSGIGVVSIGVTADVQAWVNGTNNYGWGMPTWDSSINPTWGNGTDGLGFRCSESPNIDDRPRLRVLWLPAGSVSTASFRQNVNDYTNAADTRIRQSAPDLSAATATAVLVDWDVNGSGTFNPDDVLIRFDQIIGTNPGQVPPGAVVEAAMLDLTTVSGSGYGDGGQFFAMLTPWQDTDTWNSLNNGVQADGVKAASTPTVSAGSSTLNPNVCGGYMSFEVTPDAQAWVSGIRPNYGWAILPWNGGGDGWAVSMSESTVERERPQLRLYYTAAVAPIRILSLQRGATTVTLNFSGVIGNSYSVLRAAAVTGPYSSVGSVTVQPNGTATFVDNAPLSGQAFYRISAP
jgi:hypothetical protein